LQSEPTLERRRLVAEDEAAMCARGADTGVKRVRRAADPRCMRKTMVSLPVLLVVAGCGGSQQAGKGGGSGYPVVTEPPPRYNKPITQPSGAVVMRPVKPTEHETEPSPSCERHPYKSASGEVLLVAPPRPGLTAEAQSKRTIRVSWRFEEVPEDCRPTSMAVSIVANDAPGATPTTVRVPYTGREGATKLTYPDFLPPPDVALASAEMASGRPSRTAKVLIGR
jgi:hypothetical protein